MAKDLFAKVESYWFRDMCMCAIETPKLNIHKTNRDSGFRFLNHVVQYRNGGLTAKKQKQ